VFGLGPVQNGTLKGDISRSKSIPAGAPSRQLPTTVAFGTRDQLGDPASIQFASESNPAE
jgi:hypothetical protein